MNAISLHSIVPVRATASEQSEQVTQMLFGEICTVVEQIPRWIRIKLALDGQEGWVDSKMIDILSDKEYATLTQAMEQAAMVSFPIAYAVSENNGQTIPLAAGTRLPRYANGHFEVLGVGFRIDPSMVITQALELTLNNLLQTTRFFLNTPYLWGGKNAMGMDCSGFTQIVLSLFGRRLLRNASEQAAQGLQILDLKAAQAGDLVFLSHNHSADTPKPINHVGILLDTERVIHCSGRVKVEKVDNTGILSMEQASAKHPNGVYTHYMMSIRRI
ncbi:MAG: NlpC/P60 family protein [Paludibacteraceae bacterium]